MRLPEWSAKESQDWLCRLHDVGIDTHHSSHEYDSHPRYLEALSRARSTGREFQHIVKLSSPSFDSNTFDPDVLITLVDAELRTLETDTIANVQWLVRTPDASDSQAQISVIENQTAEIIQAFGSLSTAGKVQSFSAFPYSVEFAQTVVSLLPECSVAGYLNPVETQFAPLLDSVAGFIAIRPLGGGGHGLNPASALRFSLLHPKVATSIVSLNQSHHLDDAVNAVANLEPDVEEFSLQLSQLS